MSGTDWVKWDHVAPARGEMPEVYRLPVPGGWLYAVGDRPPMFVADRYAPHLVTSPSAPPVGVPPMVTR